MDTTVATQHAAAVAREVVRIGLADQESVRKQYQDYTGYLRQGVQATFTQLLLSRGVIDQQGFDRVQAAIPLAASVGAGLPDGGGSATSEFENVLSPRADQPLELSNATPDSRGSRPEHESPVGLPEIEIMGGRPLSDSFDQLDLSGEPQQMRIASTTGSQEPSLELARDAPGGRDPSADFIMSDDEEDGGGEPKAGQVLGKYSLLKEIGRGGMGVIYSARHTKSGDMFAIKVLLGGKDKQSDRRRQRFRREVEAMRRLEHDRIVGVYDYGRRGDYDWYSMDFVEGADFEVMLEEGELEAAEKMRVYYDICEAMAHAHERNVIHRDLKPQNVLVDKSGRGHVLDFGLAKIIDQGIGMTRTGSALGTPFYMAPEQLRSAKHIDTRADVFSLGVILYEITTGVRPFRGETAAEVGTNILNIQPPRPSVLKKDLHPDIDTICIKALEKDPTHRYKDANELWEDLIRHKKGFGVDGGTGFLGVLGDVRRWVGLNKGTVGGILVTSVLFLIPLVYFAMQLPASNNTPVRRSGNDGDPDVQPNDSGDDPPSVPVDKPDTPDPVPDKPVTPDKPDTTKTPVATDTPDRPIDPTQTPDKPVKPRDETPKVPDKPVEARTPVERARIALMPPDETGPAGAAQAKEANTDKDGLRHLILSLEQDVIPAMAVGDLQRAKNALGMLRRDSKIRGMTALGREIEHDQATLERLRALVGVVLQAKPKLLKALRFYRGESVRPKRCEVLEGGFLKLSGPRWQIVDPLALSLKTLRPLVIAADKKVDNSAAHYGLAVLAIYRGEEDRSDFDKAGGSPALKRRRRFADWLEEAHEEVWVAFKADAENGWRELDRKEKQSSTALIRAMDEYVATYGRTEAYLDRRKEWIERRLKHTELESLLAGKMRRDKTGVTWNMRGDQSRDLVVRPVKGDFKSPRLFRAEFQSNSLVLENARVEFPMADLETRTGMVELSTRTTDLLSCFLGSTSQVIDPDTSWIIKSSGRKVGEEIKKRKLSRPKKISFELKKDDGLRVFRIKPDVIEIPLKAFGRPRKVKNAVLGAQSEGPLVIGELELSWRKGAGKAAVVMPRRLLRRRLLTLESVENAKGATLVQRLIPSRLTGFTFFGEWKPGRLGAIEAGKGSQLWFDQSVLFGRLEFEFACDEGPGVALHMSRSIRDGQGDVSWRLPSTVKPSPDTWRKVVCEFNLVAKSAAVVVDKVHLALPGKKLQSREVFFGIQFLGRTTGKLRNLRLFQFTPDPR